MDDALALNQVQMDSPTTKDNRGAAIDSDNEAGRAAEVDQN